MSAQSIKMVSSRGLVFGALSAFCVSVTGLAASATPNGVSAADVVVFRSCFMILALLPFAARHFGNVTDRNSRILWIRAFFGAISICCLFHNFKAASSTVGTLLSSLSPVFAFVLAAIFLKEDITKRRVIACVLAMSSPIILAFSRDGSAGLVDIGIGLVGALSAAVAFVALRASSTKHSPSLIVFLLSAMTLAFSLGLGGHLSIVVTHTFDRGLVSAAAGSLATQIFLTLCYMHLEASSAIVVTRLSVIFSAISDFLLGRIELSFSLFLSIGTVILSILILGSKFKSEKSDSPAIERQMDESTAGQLKRVDNL